MALRSRFSRGVLTSLDSRIAASFASDATNGAGHGRLLLPTDKEMSSATKGRGRNPSQLAEQLGVNLTPMETETEQLRPTVVKTPQILKDITEQQKDRSKNAHSPFRLVQGQGSMPFEKAKQKPKQQIAVITHLGSPSHEQETPKASPQPAKKIHPQQPRSQKKAQQPGGGEVRPRTNQNQKKLPPTGAQPQTTTARIDRTKASSENAQKTAAIQRPRAHTPQPAVAAFQAASKPPKPKKPVKKPLIQRSPSIYQAVSTTSFEDELVPKKIEMPRAVYSAEDEWMTELVPGWADHRTAEEIWEAELVPPPFGKEQRSPSIEWLDELTPIATTNFYPRPLFIDLEMLAIQLERATALSISIKATAPSRSITQALSPSRTKPVSRLSRRQGTDDARPLSPTVTKTLPVKASSEAASAVSGRRIPAPVSTIHPNERRIEATYNAAQSDQTGDLVTRLPREKPLADRAFLSETIPDERKETVLDAAYLSPPPRRMNTGKSDASKPRFRGGQKWKIKQLESHPESAETIRSAVDIYDEMVQSQTSAVNEEYTAEPEAAAEELSATEDAHQTEKRSDVPLDSGPTETLESPAEAAQSPDPETLQKAEEDIPTAGGDLISANDQEASQQPLPDEDIAAPAIETEQNGVEADSQSTETSDRGQELEHDQSQVTQIAEQIPPSPLDAASDFQPSEEYAQVEELKDTAPTTDPAPVLEDTAEASPTVEGDLTEPSENIEAVEHSAETAETDSAKTQKQKSLLPSLFEIISGEPDGSAESLEGHTHMASVIQSLIKKDRHTERGWKFTLLDDIGWQDDKAAPPPQGVPIPGSPVAPTTRLKAPVRSALAERFGWSSDPGRYEAPSYDPYMMEETREDEKAMWRDGKKREGPTRFRDAYGRLKARTPQERRQRAMMSGRAMEMALEGRLDEFNPDDYIEVDLPEVDIPDEYRRGRSPTLQSNVVSMTETAAGLTVRGRGSLRGRGRGRSRGRGRGRSQTGFIPNLFLQPEVRGEPEIDAPKHLEHDYYHEDALSKLGIKFTQHELMQIETTIQALVSASFNFNTQRPIPWDQLRRVSPLRYLESHKNEIRQVMVASGFEFPEQRWTSIKRNALRDMHEHEQQNKALQTTLGISPFRNIKEEKAFLRKQLDQGVTKGTPLHRHVSMALETLRQNPDMRYGDMKTFLDISRGFDGASS